VIGVFGINERVEHETGTKPSITLPGVQAQLISKLNNLGKPFVLTLTGGSAMVVPNGVETFVFQGYGSMFAGDALADVLFGRVNPSGKLPFTFYTGDEQLPPFAHYDMREFPGRTYRFLTQPPQFPFGHGLSYTRFGYQWADHDDPPVKSIKACDDLTISFDLTNTGTVSGTEISFVFVTLRMANVKTPLLELRGFERTTLDAGKSARVKVTLEKEAFAATSDDLSKRGAWIISPGTATIWVGGGLPTATKGPRATLQRSVQISGSSDLEKCPNFKVL